MTEKGRALFPVITALWQWGDQWFLSRASPGPGWSTARRGAGRPGGGPGGGRVAARAGGREGAAALRRAAATGRVRTVAAGSGGVREWRRSWWRSTSCRNSWRYPPRSCRNRSSWSCCQATAATG
ncbi:hypothetical protein ACGF12_12180 [Kitasatospora sp. NPDC048296]|uniref:hypothetical protein n=1 Tax=Kitasatospora sp. NPDC048296 TaxID=3364048 RepID=UPI003712C222